MENATQAADCDAAHGKTGIATVKEVAASRLGLSVFDFLN
jgi:hypothetical protein